jgi:hypothetical protein
MAVFQGVTVVAWLHDINIRISFVHPYILRIDIGLDKGDDFSFNVSAVGCGIAQRLVLAAWILELRCEESKSYFLATSPAARRVYHLWLRSMIFTWLSSSGVAHLQSIHSLHVFASTWLVGRQLVTS